jgi:hypothetical protein
MPIQARTSCVRPGGLLALRWGAANIAIRVPKHDRPMPPPSPTQRRNQRKARGESSARSGYIEKFGPGWITGRIASVNAWSNPTEIAVENAGSLPECRRRYGQLVPSAGKLTKNGRSVLLKTLSCSCQKDGTANSHPSESWASANPDELIAALRPTNCIHVTSRVPDG